MKTYRSMLIVIAVLIFSSVGLFFSTSFARPSNKWRIQVSEGANSDGEIVFKVMPKDENPIEIHVAIKDGTRENKVARTISDTFKAQLPGDKFHVEVDDGEDVLVKKKGDGKNFDLTVVDNTVKSVRINLDRE